MSGPGRDDRAPYPPERNGSAGRNRRLLWFVAFYAVSLVVFTALVYALRIIVRG